MRNHGIQGAHPANPEIIALAAQGVTLDTIESAILDVKERKPGESVNVRYIVIKLEDWAKKAAAVQVAGAKPPAQGQGTPKQHDEWWRSNEGTDRKGREIGMQARPSELYGDFRARIFDEIRKRQEQVPA